MSGSSKDLEIISLEEDGDQEDSTEKDCNFKSVYSTFGKKCLQLEHLPLNTNYLNEYIILLSEFAKRKTTLNLIPKHFSIVKYLKLNCRKELVHKHTGQKIMSIEALFEDLFEKHKELGHKGGVPALRSHFDDTYYVPKYVYKYFMQSCTVCQKNVPKQIVFNKVIHLDWLNPRVVSLENDGDFNFIVIHYDLATNFVLLRPLHGLELTEIANELFKLFMDFGTPDSAQCSAINSALFQSACDLLNASSLIQSHISVKPVNHMLLADKCSKILNEIKEWTVKNESGSWAVGCSLVQSKMNNEKDDKGLSPYDYVFRRKKVAKVLEQIQQSESES